jgi:hypothetical protein
MFEEWTAPTKNDSKQEPFEQPAEGSQRWALRGADQSANAVSEHAVSVIYESQRALTIDVPQQGSVLQPADNRKHWAVRRTGQSADTVSDMRPTRVL